MGTMRLQPILELNDPLLLFEVYFVPYFVTWLDVVTYLPGTALPRGSESTDGLVWLVKHQKL